MAITPPRRAHAVLAALAGLAAVSHGVIFIRLADEAPALTIALARVAIATAVFAPLAAAGARRAAALSGPELRRAVRLSLVAGLFLAVHFAAWIASLERITIAESVVLVSLTPIWIALVDIAAGRGRPDRATLAAIALCLAGTAVIAFDGTRRVDGDALGLALATLGGLGMAGYLVAGRTVRASLPTPAYVTLCYGTAAAALGAGVAAAGLPVTGFAAETYLALAALGLVSQVVGHTTYNWTLSALPPVFVAVCLLGEPVLGSLFGWLYLDEAIPPGTAAGGAVILVGLYLAVRAELRAPAAGAG